MRELLVILGTMLALAAVICDSRESTRQLDQTLAASSIAQQINFANQYK